MTSPWLKDPSNRSNSVRKFLGSAYQTLRTDAEKCEAFVLGSAGLCLFSTFTAGRSRLQGWRRGGCCWKGHAPFLCLARLTQLDRRRPWTGSFGPPLTVCSLPPRLADGCPLLMPSQGLPSVCADSHLGSLFFGSQGHQSSDQGLPP